MVISIVFFGTPEFAVPSLAALTDHADFEIQAVITNPDKPAGRGQKISESAVKQYAQKRNSTVLQPSSLRSKEFLNLMESLRPDFFVVVSYGKIFPKALLRIPRFGAINVHPSLLPRYRGATPIPEALLHGDRETGVTIMRLSEELDSGDIFFTKCIPIDPDDHAGTLAQKLAIIAGTLLPSVLLDIANNTLRPLPQNHAQASYCSKISKKDGRIDWKKYTAEEIINRIRAYTPWPGCDTIWNGTSLKILKARTISGNEAMPGEIVIFDKSSFGIRAKQRFLVPITLQLSGKSITAADAFLRGYEKRLRAAPFCT